MTEQKVNKWQQELGQLENKAFKKATSELENAYQYGFASLMHDLKRWVDNYETMTTSQQREFDRRMSVANALSDVVDKIGSKVDGTVGDYVRGAGERGYQGTLYSLEAQHRIDLADTIIDPNYLEQLVNQPVGPEKFSKTMYERLNIDRQKLAGRTEQAIMDGLWRGEGYDKIAGRISELSGASYNAATRIARTEGGRVQSQTTQQAYKDANDQGIDIKKRWLATLDGKTRADHRVLDGQTVGLDEMFHVDGFKAMGPHLFGAASEDINCRCTTIPIVGDIEPSLRVNNETGRHIQYRTYDEWVNKKKVSKKQPKKPAKKPEITNVVTDFKQGTVWPDDTELTDEQVEMFVKSMPVFMTDANNNRQFTSRFGGGTIRTIADLRSAVEIFRERTKLLPAKYKKMPDRMMSRIDNMYSDANEVPYKQGERYNYDWDTIFDDKTIKLLTKKRFKDVQAFLDEAPEEQRALFAKFASKSNFNGKRKEAGYYSRQDNGFVVPSDNLNLLTDEEAARAFHKPMQVFFHENAHNIDDISTMTDEYFSQSFRDSKGNAFVDVLLDDLKKFYDDNIPAQGYKVDGTEYSSLLDDEFYRFKKKMRKEHGSAINDWGNVSDLLEGFANTWNKRGSGKHYKMTDYGFNGGHGSSYFKADGRALTVEAFAEFTDAYMISARYPQVLEVMRQAMPNAIKFYDEMVLAMIGGK